MEEGLGRRIVWSDVEHIRLPVDIVEYLVCREVDDLGDPSHEQEKDES